MIENDKFQRKVFPIIFNTAKPNTISVKCPGDAVATGRISMPTQRLMKIRTKKATAWSKIDTKSSMRRICDRRILLWYSCS